VSRAVEVVGLDADDTLWHNESLFSVTHDRFAELLADHTDPDDLGRRMLETERRNLHLFGYGAKGFTLSMIETALEVTDGDLPGSHVQAILDLGKALLAHPVDLLDGVREAIEALADRRLVLITKGDLFHQETKVAGSGLGEHFERIEIVSEKDETTYRKVLADLGIEPHEFLMVGNAMRSDILPVVAIGGRAVHVPYAVDWAHEVVDEADHPDEGWWRVESLAELPALLTELES
jgi:putative hydrolase of the HAD superfamily